MSNHQETLRDEFEVLESIYPDELEKLAEDAIRISVVPEEQTIDEEVRLSLEVRYPAEYPDTIPELDLDVVEGELSAEERLTLLATMATTAEENLGMAQTFSIITALIDAVGLITQERAKRKRDLKAERDRELEEAELRRIRGTPVTVESFQNWRVKFNKEKQLEKRRQDDERLRDMSNKEKEEFKKIQTRLTGRQLFERNKDLATADDSMVEEEEEAVDISTYARAHPEEEEEEERLQFSDSD